MYCSDWEYSIGFRQPTIQSFSRMVLLLYAMVTRRKFNKGKFIFQKIVEEAGNSSTITHLGYPVLITQYLLQQGIQHYKVKTISTIQKLKISPKLFAYEKKINLPIGWVSPPSPFTSEEEVPSLHIEDDYEKLFLDRLEDLEGRQRSFSAKLIIIKKKKQSVHARLEALMQKKWGATSTNSLAIQGELQAKLQPLVHQVEDFATIYHKGEEMKMADYFCFVMFIFMFQLLNIFLKTDEFFYVWLNVL